MSQKNADNYPKEYVLFACWGVATFSPSDHMFGLVGKQEDVTFVLGKEKLKSISEGGGCINVKTAIEFRDFLTRFIDNPSEIGLLKKDFTNESI